MFQQGLGILAAGIEQVPGLSQRNLTLSFDVSHDFSNHLVVGGGGKHHAVAHLDYSALFDEEVKQFRLGHDVAGWGVGISSQRLQIGIYLGLLLPAELNLVSGEANGCSFLGKNSLIEKFMQGRGEGCGG